MLRYICKSRWRDKLNVKSAEDHNSCKTSQALSISLYAHKYITCSKCFLRSFNQIQAKCKRNWEETSILKVLLKQNKKSPTDRNTFARDIHPRKTDGRGPKVELDLYYVDTNSSKKDKFIYKTESQYIKRRRRKVRKTYKKLSKEQ